jgi:hypothetical protein
MRQYDEDFLIDGKPILIPDEGVQISLEDLDSSESGRDESGVMHRIVIREKVRKYSIPYGILSKEEYMYLQSLFAGKPTFEVQKREPDGTIVRFSAYCSKIGITIQNKRTGMYKGLTLNIIEC